MGRYEYKLTIAIPTFNRKDVLRQCLKSIIPQMTDQVEIYISDNCSTDGTEKLFQEEFTDRNIVYSRNEQNIGSDKNFLKCYTEGRGEYIHLLSDDDLMLPGTVAFLLNCIKEKPSVIYLRACNIEDADTAVIDGSYTVYRDIPGFLQEMGVYITLISTMALRKEYILTISDMTKFIGTNFPQSYVAIECLRQGGCAVIKDCPAIAYRTGDAHGYSFYQVWIYQFLKLMQYLSVAGCNDRDIRRISTGILNHDILGFILGFRVHGTELDMSETKYLFQGIKKYPETWIRLLSAAFLPRSILCLGSKIKHAVKRSHS